LATVGVSETTRRLDFRREYEEELARLDQPEEPISIQLAQQLLSGGVPTVNQGVTDEFPQGGIAGQQQTPQQAAPAAGAAPQQGAALQQGAAPQAATPQAAPAAGAAAAPAGGAGPIPGGQIGGLVALLKALAPAIGGVAGAAFPRTWQAGKGVISPIIKNITEGFKPAVRSLGWVS
jgi:succinate dehydrogenase/fumarate reductase flavoprotein subunit